MNKDKKIQGISSSCIKLMSLDLNMMKRLFTAGYDISKLAPEIEEHHDELLQSKNGLIIEWTIPFMQKRKIKPGDIMDKIKSNSLNKGPQNTKSEDKQQHQTKIIKKKFKFLCQLNPIYMASFGDIGNYIRLEHIRSENDNASLKAATYK